MDEIKDIVQSVFGKLDKRQPTEENKLEGIWRNVLNEKEKKHTALIGIREGVLSVAVDTPAWLYQMKIKKGRILRKIQEEISEVKNIYFKIGNVS